MKELFSECLGSESRRDGLKQISVSIHNLLLNNKDITYQKICSSINTSNTNTLRRRVYDVLSVMRSLNMVVKAKRCYNLVRRNLLCEKRMVVEEKRKQLEDLQHMKEVFEHIVLKNAFKTHSLSLDRFYLPFMIVVAEKDSNVHCETNEERTFFKFRSSKPIKLVEDLDILKELYKNNEEKEAKKPYLYENNLKKFKEGFGGAFDYLI
ncbi:E2F-like protein [Trachipleistophora hominis]|uniref:E2F-like protein n=1 Tax=Trachipleistophora hominis TaxID=72359 RepID=L7JSG8_TRAHO|nr:E2F-like protein [Trachipleistophora hominis]